MILTNKRILEEVQFEPALDSFQVNPHSIDLRLEAGYNIRPGATMQFRTLEKVTLPDDVMAVVYPRSSTNRRGLHVHMTGVVDAGYSGHLIVPVTNTNDMDVPLMTGERIASLIFHRLEERVTPRESKYHEKDGKHIPDKEAETVFLNSGNMEGLKAMYPLF